MEELLEFLLEPLLELLLCCVLEALGELLGVAPVSDDRRPVRPVVAGAGFFTAGAVIGFVVSLDFPARFMLPTHAVPGASLVIAPLATGLAMHFFGKLRRQHGGHPSRLATYWGGGLFAFGVALVRFLMVGR